MHEQYILQPTETGLATRNISSPETQNCSEEWLTIVCTETWQIKSYLPSWPEYFIHIYCFVDFHNQIPWTYTCWYVHGHNNINTKMNKFGHIEKSNNYRDISLGSVISKINDFIILTQCQNTVNTSYI